mmetsp:Transcript_38970/g.81536  ORF Transcript_38970/g.81536 Transcript_38970/m.81536 type:complete len:278 (-) Transcript_38970:103-936(-)
MRFTLFKLSAFALVATSMVSAEKSALRGPVVATSDTVVEGSASSVDVDSKSNGKSKSNDLKAVKLPKFFPTDLTEDQIISFKKSAAEKRQEQRDARRARDNPNRTQSEEDAERARKTDQSRKRGDPSVDPYSGNGSRDFGRNREAKRAANCERNGEGCNYSGPNQSCYNDCLSGTSLSDRVCARKCKYIDTECNEDCRDDGGSIRECLDECQENIDDDGDLRRNRNDNDDLNDDFNDDFNDGGRNNRSNCEINCRESFNINSKKYTKCIVACPNENA